MLNKRDTLHGQQGFSLIEVLIAALLFAVSLLGLLQYHQVLLQAFQRQWQYQQAWLLAHQQLEILHASSGRVDNVDSMLDNTLALPVNWQRQIEIEPTQPGCWRRTVKIYTPLRQQAELSRWYCSQ